MSVRSRIRAVVRPGDVLDTPNGQSRFTVADITHESMTILVGETKTPRHFTWELLEETLRAIPTDDWMPVGAAHASKSKEGSLEALFMPRMSTSRASYVAALFAKAGLVNLDISGTHRLRRI